MLQSLHYREQERSGPAVINVTAKISFSCFLNWYDYVIRRLDEKVLALLILGYVDNCWDVFVFSVSVLMGGSQLTDSMGWFPTTKWHCHQ